MRFVAMFVAGAALALGITFLSGNLEFGGDSGSGSAQAIPIPTCVLALDFNGDGQLGVEDVLLFKNAIETQNLAFDKNGDNVVDIHDVIFVVQQVVTCFQQQQPPPLP